jgi:hypothetical protein
MIIKPSPATLAGVLVAVTTAGIAVSAFAQTKATVSSDTCYSLAVERGSGPQQSGAPEHSQHKAFMDQCMAGNIPLTTERSPPATSSLGGAFASASVPKHTSRRRAAPSFRTELGTQYRLPRDLQRHDGYHPDPQIVGPHN